MALDDDRDYGHSFLEEFRRLEGRLSDWSPSVVRELERADRERVISILSPSGGESPGRIWEESTVRIVQCAKAQTPADLARVVIDEMAMMNATTEAVSWPFLIL